MKKFFYYLCMGFVGMVLLNSCDEDDDILASQVPVAVRTTFETMYPNVITVEWEKNRGYYLAEFWHQSSMTEVWFDEKGEWRMTETDISFDNLPESVYTVYQESLYANWRIDDIDKFERPTETFYLLEIEKNDQRDRNLFYAEDGTLLKDEADKENFEVLPDIAF